MPDASNHQQYVDRKRHIAYACDPGLAVVHERKRSGRTPDVQGRRRAQDQRTPRKGAMPMRRRKDLVRVALAVFCVVLLVPGEMLSMAGVQPEDAWDMEGAASMGVGLAGEPEFVWEGGGPSRLFEDDMSPSTAQHFAGMGLEDYYGGAVKAPGSGPDVWRHEPFRYGLEGRTTLDPWQIAAMSETNGAWHFGREGPDGLEYPRIGGEAAVVTPVIDLRSVPQVDVSQRLVVDTALSLADHHDEEVHVSESAAALRLRHAYDFRFDRDTLLDGARVEYAVHDPATGWSSWQGLDPTDDALRVGEETIMGRKVAPTGDLFDAEVRAAWNLHLDRDELPDQENLTALVPDPDNPSVPAPGDVEGQVPDPEQAVEKEVEVEGNATHREPNEHRQGSYGDLRANDSDDPRVAEGPINETTPPPWRYQGEIDASIIDRAERWRGFGGGSEGLVESVFDLSNAAGHLVRLRFVVASQAPHSADHPWLRADGWLLDALQVTGLGDPGIDIVDMAEPGNGAVIHPDQGPDFELSVMLHNRFAEPIEGRTEFDLENGGSSSVPFSLSAGTTARSLVKAPDTYNGLGTRSGLQRLDVTASATTEVAAGSLTGFVPNGAPAQERFHFVFGPGGGAADRQWDVLHVNVVPEGEPVGTRTVNRDQPIEVRATLRNLASNETKVLLNESGLHPVFRDVRGKLVGIGEPVDSKEVALAVTRDVSGALGDTSAEVTVNWTWPGSDAARPLELFLETAEGDVVMEGGRILVESVEPSALTWETSNEWNIGDSDDSHSFSNNCTRFGELENRKGVVRCGEDDTLVSPVMRVTTGELTRGENFTLQVGHRDGNFTVEAYHHPSVPDPALERSPLDSGWSGPFKEFEAPPANGRWNVTQWEAKLPDGCVREGQRGCWLFLAFKGGTEDDWMLEEVQPGIEGLPFARHGRETFATSLLVQEVELQAQDQDLLWLHGRDAWAEDVDGQAGVAKVDKGDVTLDGLVIERTHYPSGRVVDDSVVEFGPIPLQGAKPALVFDHWYDLGTGGRATVEVARLQGDIAGPWETVHAFQGSLNPPPDMRSERVSLTGFAGESLDVRFKYSIDPQGDFSAWESAGWFLERIRVDEQTSEGFVSQDLMDAGLEVDRANTARDGSFDMGVETGATVSRKLAEPKVHLEFSRDMDPCAVRSDAGLYGVNSPRYGRGPIVVTDPINLQTAREPVLELVHWGVLSNRDNRFLQQVEYDLEYQIQGSDGERPGTWQRATPHQPMNLGSDDEMGRQDLANQSADQHAETLVQPNGAPAKEPFYQWDRDNPINDEDDGVWTDQESPWRNIFDLEPLLGEVVRFRLNAWSIWTDWGTTSPGTAHSRCLDGALDWNIEQFIIREQRHFIDAGANDFELDRDDARSIANINPEAAGIVGDSAVVANDQFNALVPVVNDGINPLDEVRVSLEASFLGDGSASGLDILAIGPDGRPSTNTNQGSVFDLASGAKQVKRFHIDASRAAPGEYLLTAVVNPVDGEDTNPANDLKQMRLFVAPYRHLALGEADSTVHPFVATPLEERTVQINALNQGNVEEDNVEVQVELVRRTGLTEAEPLTLPGDPLKERSVAIARRDGLATLRWTLTPEDLVDGAGEPVLEPGGSYAFRIKLDAAEDSVKSWWLDTAQNLQPTTDPHLLGTDDHLVDLSQGRQFLIPFLVEDSIFRDDLGGNSTSIIPATFAGDLPPMDMWQRQTFVDGKRLDKDEHSWIPRWELNSVSEIPAEGTATGKAWYLPSYEGVEDVTHELVSPPLPSHVVSANSSAILDLQYAHGLSEGQAIVESRKLQWDDESSKWIPRDGPAGKWVPADQTRAQRVAVVLPPDFPHVTGTWIGSTQESLPSILTDDEHRTYCQFYDGRRAGRCDLSDDRETRGGHYENVTVPDHPWPPFYESTSDGWRAVDGREPAHRNQFRAWSPFPADNTNGDPEWVQALYETLRQLAESFGPENVGLFTEPSPDFGLDLGSLDNPRLEVARDGAGSFEFALNDLNSLGRRLDTYGGLLVMGDNATTTLASHSDHMRRMAHNETQAYNTSLGIRNDADHPWREHLVYHENLHEILRGAGPAGVRVIGALGPASGSLALSGAAAGETMAVWQNPHVPWGEDADRKRSFMDAEGDLEYHNAQVRCLVDNHPGSDSANYNDVRVELDDLSREIRNIHAQPMEMCEYNTGGPNFGPGDRREPAPDLEFNYFYVSPEDARSLALRDFLAAGDVEWAGPDAEEIVRSRQDGGPLFVTAAEAKNALDWVDAVKQELRRTSGALKDGSGNWETLPPDLSINFAGEFEVGPLGNERFVGNPAQFRIRIQADPDLEGHGFFALDRFGVMGSPHEEDVSVRFLEPETRGEYAPGAPFEVFVETTNRGINETPLLEGRVRVTQPEEGTCAGECFWDELSGKGQWEHDLAMEPLPGGGQRVIKVPFNSDRFPDVPQDPGSGQSAFNFEIEMQNFPEWYTNADPFNNRSIVEAFGLERIQIEMQDVVVVPSATDHAGTPGIEVEGRLANLGTKEMSVRLSAHLEMARPADCVDPDPDANPEEGPYRSCDPTKDGPVLWDGPIPLGELDTTVARRHTFDFAISGSDLDAQGIAPGVWLVVVEALVETPSGFEKLDRQVKWLNLADTSIAPDEAWPAHRMGLRDLVELQQTEPMTGFRGIDDDRADWQVPPAGQDMAVEGGALDVGPPRHRGLLGEDWTTLGPQGDPLQHGWAMLDDQEVQDGPLGGNVARWTRGTQPSTQEGTMLCDERSGSSNGECGSSDWDRRDVATWGYDDFGTDWIVWQPEYTPDGAPFSLVSFEEPVLRMLSRHQVTDHTGLVVEAQVAKRVCSDDRSDERTDPQEPQACAWEWHWDEGGNSTTRGDPLWTTIEGKHTKASTVGSTKVADCNTTNQGDTRFCSRRLSNPLAGRPGIWGGQSVGEHDGTDWQVLDYDLVPLLEPGEGSLYEHCVAARDSSEPLRQKGGLSGDGPVNTRFPVEYNLDAAHFDFPYNDPCRYAWSNGFWDEDEKDGEPIPRPIRFRFAAASFGGDEGVNWWEIAEASLSDHKLRFETTQRELRMEDNDKRIVPFRLENPSRVPDEVSVTWNFPQDQSFGEDEVNVGLARSPLGPFRDELTFTLPPQSSIAVFVQVEVGLEHGLSPNQRVGLPVLVEARSLRDPTALAMGLLDGEFRTQAWGDLEVNCVMVGDDDACEQTALAAVGVPVSVTAAWRNRGEVPLGNETDPIVLRLVEERLKDGQVVDSSVARDANGVPAERILKDPAAPSRALEHVTMEWDPPTEGIYRLRAEINLPGVGDDLIQLPESDTGNNRFDRFVAVGPVPLSDLRIHDAWLEEFRSGERADRLIDGHLYVVNAKVVNEGRAAAREFATEFRVAAADPFSRSARDSFDGEHHNEVLFSTPWQARLQVGGGAEWTFAVDVSTITPEASVKSKTFSWDVRVDSYTLGVSDVPRNITLVPGEEVRVPINITNTGNVAATPTADLGSSAESIDVRLGGSSRLEAGETQTRELVIAASEGLVEGADLPGIQLGVREDPLREVRVPMELVVRGEGRARAVAHPMTAVPGIAPVQLGLVNAGNAAANWRIVDATAPLEVIPWNATIDPFSSERVDADIQVRNVTLPGYHHAEIELEAEADGVIRRLWVPVDVQVEPEARFEARAEPADQTVPLGRSGSLLIHLVNTGNVPLPVGLNHTVDDGSLTVGNTSALERPLQPGQGRVQEVRADPSQGSRQVLGVANATWEWTEGNVSGSQEIQWRVAFEDRRVRIANAGLDELVARAGQHNEVSVTVENPMERSVGAEILVVVDGTVHDVQEITLSTQGRTTVVLPYQVGAPGEGHDLMVMARPAGSTANPTDPVYYEVGDAQGRHIVVVEADDVDRQVVPGPGMLGFLALLAVALLLRRTWWNKKR